MGGGTPVQEACGYHDTRRRHVHVPHGRVRPGADEAKVRVFCAESVAHFHWLEAHGVPFKRSFYPEPSMEAPTDDCLVFSGGEDAYPFDRADAAGPARPQAAASERAPAGS